MFCRLLAENHQPMCGITKIEETNSNTSQIKLFVSVVLAGMSCAAKLNAFPHFALYLGLSGHR